MVRHWKRLVSRQLAASKRASFRRMLVESLSSRVLLAGDLATPDRAVSGDMDVSLHQSVPIAENASVEGSIVTRTLSFEAAHARRISLDYSANRGNAGADSNSDFMLEHEVSQIDLAPLLGRAGRYEIATSDTSAFAVLPFVEDGKLTFQASGKPGISAGATIEVQAELPRGGAARFDVVVDNRETETQPAVTPHDDSDFWTLVGEGEGTPMLTMQDGDNMAQEPHSIYCSGPDLSASVDIDRQNYQGDLTFEIHQSGGDAVYGVDWTFGSTDEGAIAPKPGTPGVFLLTVPTGSGIYSFGIVAEDDGVEPTVAGESPSETVTLTFVNSSANGVTLGGSATVTIQDETEGLQVIATPGSIAELDDAIGNFQVQGTGGESICAPIQWQILNASGAEDEDENLATLGADYVDPGGFGPASPPDAQYPTLLETAGGQDPSLPLVIDALQDEILEGSEKVKARAVAGSIVSDFATMEITEDYRDGQVDKYDKNDSAGCSCTCVCADGNRIKVDSDSGSAEVTTLDGFLKLRTTSQNGHRPVLQVGMTLPSDMAVPEQVTARMQVVESRVDGQGELVGLGRRPVSQNAFASELVTIDVPASAAAGSTLWFSIQADLSAQAESWPRTQSGGTGTNGQIIPLEVVVNASFASGTASNQQFNGWIARTNHAMLDESESMLAPGLGTNVSVAGVSYLLRNQSIMVPNDPTATGNTGGGKVKLETGSMLLRDDGTTSWFSDSSGSAPETQEELVGDTLTDRYRRKMRFDSNGDMIERIDASGNVTSFTYNADGTLADITDPFGLKTTFTYGTDGSGNAMATITTVNTVSDALSHRTRRAVWNPTPGSGPTTFKVQYDDPDGTGPRAAREDVFSYGANNRMTSVATGEVGNPTHVTTFSYETDPDKLAALSRIDYPDGSSLTIDLPRLSTSAIPAGYSGGVITDASAYKMRVLSGGATANPIPNFSVTTYKHSPNSTPQRTIYQTDHRGRIVRMWDAEQVHALGLSSTTTWGDSAFDTLAANQDLSYESTLASPSRDALGQITGDDWGQVLSTTAPDPDRILVDGVEQSDGPRTNQVTTNAFDANNNLVSNQQPIQPIETFVWNDTFDRLTALTDVAGNQYQQVIDAVTGLVTQTNWSERPIWQNSSLPADVNGDGNASPLDALQLQAYINASAGEVPVDAVHAAPFYDVNGDGFVTQDDRTSLDDYLNSLPPGTGPILTIPAGARTLEQVDFEYSTTPNLPVGLTTRQTVSSGRASGDVIVDYEYYNTPGDPVRHGKVRKIIEAPGRTIEATTEYFYDNRGNLNRMLDPAGRETKLFYDQRDRLTAMLYPDPDASQALLPVLIRYDYDVFDNVISSEVINSWLDNGLLRVSALKTSYVYDDVNRMTEEITQDPNLIWYLDASGGNMVHSQTAPTGASLVTTTDLENYALANAPILNAPAENTSYQGRKTSYDYYGTGDTLTITESDAGSSPRVSKMVFDRLDRVVEMVTPDPVQGLFTTEGDQRELASAGGFVSRYQYDHLGNVVKAVDGLGRTTLYEYDDLNRVTRVTEPDVPVVDSGSDALAAAGVTIVDDGDIGFSRTGAWGYWGQAGYEGDYEFIGAGSGGTATWQFDVEPGTYELSGTWVGAGNHATNAPINVFVDGSILGSVTLNQSAHPNDFQDAGTWWEQLGSFTVDGTVLTVTLSTHADSFVIADAFRLEKVSGAQIVDNDDIGFTKLGTWGYWDQAGHESDYYYVGPGGSDTAFWTFFVEPGLYELSGTWIGAGNHATNTPIEVFDGLNSLGTLAIDQSQNPDDFVEDSTAWETLGTFRVTDSYLQVRMNNNANSFVIADAMRLEKVTDVQVVDNEDAEFSTSGLWSYIGQAGYQGSYVIGSPGLPSIATWSFTVEPGTYEVAGTWLGGAGYATDTPIEIFQGLGDQVGEVSVDQTQAPDDFQSRGGWWESLGTFTVEGTTLDVLMSNDANSIVLRDAFRISRVADARIVDNLDGSFSKTQGWALASNTGYADNYYYSGPGTGDTATWDFTNLESGNYRIAASWVGAGNHASNTPVSIYDNGTLIGSTTLDQTHSPDDFQDNSTWWENLGTFAVGSSTLSIVMSDNANTFVVADAFRIEKVTPSVQIIDDDDPGFSRSGAWGYWNQAGHESDYYFAGAGGGDWAEWTFQVEPGRYRLSGTWQHAGNHASDTPILLYDGGNYSTSRTLNQQLAPTDFYDASSWWAEVGMFDVTGNTFTVRMHDGANFFVVADAFRLESIDEPVTGQNTAFDYALGWNGWQVTTTNPADESTDVQYDALGRIIRTQGDTPTQHIRYFTDGLVREVTDELQRTTSYDYDPRGRLTSWTTPPLQFGYTTSYVYSVDSLLEQMTDPLGRITQYSYDAGGRLTQTTLPDPDGLGPLASPFTGRALDGLGNVMSVTDAALAPQSKATHFVRDAWFRTLQEIDPDGGVSGYAYDVYDNVTSLTDPLGNTTSYAYNPLDQLVSEDQGGQLRSFEYDGVGNLRSSLDRNGRLTKFDYDALNRRIGESWLTGSNVDRVLSYGYDRVGRLTQVLDSDAAAPDFQFSYDARGQMQTEFQSHRLLDPSSDFGQSLIFDRDYDAFGNQIRLAANVGGDVSGGSIIGGVWDFENEYTFDGQNRLTSIAQSSVLGGNAVAAKLAEYAYDPASQRTDLKRYSSETASTGALEVHSRYGYDGAGRLTSIAHSRAEIASGYTWDGTSNVPTSITPADMLAGYHLQYDADNRLTGFSSYSDGFSTSYGYDARDQLTSATSSAIAGLSAPFLPAVEAYDFDAGGNRRDGSGGSQSASGSYNQIQSDGTYDYVYDDEGNLTGKTHLSSGAVTEYTWDHRNRLTSVTDRPSAGGSMTQYVALTYDALDQLVGKQVDADGDGTLDRSEVYAWADGQEVLRFVDSDGVGVTQPHRLANRYLWGAVVDELLADEQYAAGAGPAVDSSSATTQAGETLWALTDHLGSVRDLVDNGGTIRQHVVYDSFGNRVSEQDYNSSGLAISSTDPAAIDSLFGYTGRLFDEDIQLQSNRARWYDPKQGRWISQDPIGFEAGDANLYRYVGNGPTNATDPSGLQEADEAHWTDDDYEWPWYHPNRYIAGTFNFFFGHMTGAVENDIEGNKHRLENLEHVGEGKLTTGGNFHVSEGTTEAMKTLAETAINWNASAGEFVCATSMVGTTTRPLLGTFSEAVEQAKRTSRIDPRRLRFTQATASPNLSSGSKDIAELIGKLKGNPKLIEKIPALEVVEYNGKLYSLNNRRLVAYQQAGITDVPINILSLDDTDVLRRFRRQVRDGLIDDGTKIIIVQGKKSQAEARRIAGEHGRLCDL